LGGVRMVGRVGAWDIGVLDMQTAKFDGSAGENFGVFRFRRQVLNPYSYMGGIVTSRVGTDGKVNAAYGLDGIFRVFNNDYFSFKWAQTFESDKDNPLFSTDSARYRFYWHRPGSTGWRYAFGHSRAGAEYEPGMGFEQRRNFSAVDGVFGYGWMVSDKSSALNYHRVKGTGEIIWSNETDALESAKGAVSWYFLTRGNYELEIRPGYRVEHVREAFTMSGGLTIMPGKYRFANVYANFRLPGGSLFHTTLEVDAGSFYGGKRYAVSLSPSWAMSPALELSAFYRFTHIRLPGEAQKLNAHITRFRMLWMPSVKVSGTAFVQYNSAARLMLANVRLRYNPREGVDLYLVYNENFNTDRRLETPSLPISAHRTVMMKCTYTFQL
ncbi:MAG: hypothetical protein GY765_42595, partial [bacterium]|nr:hypothetical protein [bacterium]